MSSEDMRPASPRQYYLAACADERLVYQQGVEEGAVFPPRLPETGWADPLEWRDSSGNGTVYSVTVIHPRNEDPFALALIDLAEGFRMMSRIDVSDPYAVRIGLPVVVRFRQLEEDGPKLPVFVPVEQAA